MRSTGPGLQRGRFPSARQTEVVRRRKQKGHRQLRLQEAAGRGCPGQFHGESPHGECTRPAPPSRRRPRPPERCPPPLLAPGLCVWKPGRGGPVPGRELLGLPLAPRVPTLFLSISIFPQRTYSRSAYSCAPPQARSGLPAGGQPPTESLPGPGAERQGAFPAALRASSAGGPPGRGATAGAALGAGARSPGAGGECAQL